MTDAEYGLLRTLAPELTKRLGSIRVQIFSASFMAHGWWVARIDYCFDGQDPSKCMKSLLIEGHGEDEIHNTTSMRPRIFREVPSVVILREGLIQLEMESPDLGERVS